MSELMVQEVQEVESKDSAPVQQWADALIVDTEASYTEAVKAMAECARRARAVEEKLEKNKKETYAAYKGVMDLIKDLSGKWLKVKDVLQKKAGAWKRAEDDRLARERAEAQREAQKKAEEERLKMAINLEAKKVSSAVIDRVMAAPVVAAPVTVERRVDTAKAEGVSWRESWIAEVTDITALIKAAAADDAVAEYINPNMTAINAMARLMKDKCRIPGVTVRCEKIPVVRGR